jgi:hypothetical protein
LPTGFPVFPTKKPRLTTKAKITPILFLICRSNQTPKIMNYKVKSLIYLFAFIISALLYQQMDDAQGSETIEQSREISMNGTMETTGQNVL